MVINTVVYGPVPSRRLGRSLGINNIPPKVCSYSCVYCQLGNTLNMQVEQQTFYEPERDRTVEGKWMLDFNQAYNPWCVYSKAYTCPFVPAEHWLGIPIQASEKSYPLK